MPRKGRGRSGDVPTGPIPLAVRRVLLEQRRPSTSSVEGNSSGSISGSKRKASKATSQSVSPSSSSGSQSRSGSGSGSGSENDSNSVRIFESVSFKANPEGKLFLDLAKSIGNYGQMLLLMETPSGFALFSFSGVHCYLPDSVNDIWAKFADYCQSCYVVSQKGFRSFEDKSSAINADTGVDKKLVDLINDWRLPGMKLCVGKPEYKVIIESKLKIPCMYCETVMEIIWGIQHQMRKLVPQEKSELTKEDRLHSQGLKKFLCHNGFDVKPEMVNEKIVAAASALFDCDAADKRNLFFLREAGLHIRDISGISCESWDILKLAIAVKVICCPGEKLTDFHEVLAKDELSKLKGDALKYNGITGRSNWLRTCNAAVSTYKLRIAKKKLLGSLVKEAYEAEAVKVCEKGKLQGESEQIPKEHVILANSYSSVVSPMPPVVPITPSSLSMPFTCLVGEVVRRSPRLNPKFYQNSGGYKHACLDGTPSKRLKYCGTPSEGVY